MKDHSKSYLNASSQGELSEGNLKFFQFIASYFSKHIKLMEIVKSRKNQTNLVILAPDDLQKNANFIKDFISLTGIKANLNPSIKNIVNSNNIQIILLYDDESQDWSGWNDLIQILNSKPREKISIYPIALTNQIQDARQWFNPKVAKIMAEFLTADFVYYGYGADYFPEFSLLAELVRRIYEINSYDQNYLSLKNSLQHFSKKVMFNLEANSDEKSQLSDVSIIDNGAPSLATFIPNIVFNFILLLFNERVYQEDVIKKIALYVSIENPKKAFFSHPEFLLAPLKEHTQFLNLVDDVKKADQVLLINDSDGLKGATFSGKKVVLLKCSKDINERDMHLLIINGLIEVLTAIRSSELFIDFPEFYKTTTSINSADSMCASVMHQEKKPIQERAMTPQEKQEFFEVLEKKLIVMEKEINDYPLDHSNYEKYSYQVLYMWLLHIYGSCFSSTKRFLDQKNTKHLPSGCSTRMMESIIHFERHPREAHFNLIENELHKVIKTLFESYKTLFQGLTPRGLKQFIEIAAMPRMADYFSSLDYFDQPKDQVFSYYLLRGFQWGNPAIKRRLGLEVEHRDRMINAHDLIETHLKKQPLILSENLDQKPGGIPMPLTSADEGVSDDSLPISRLDALEAKAGFNRDLPLKELKNASIELKYEESASLHRPLISDGALKLAQYYKKDLSSEHIEILKNISRSSQKLGIFFAYFYKISCEVKLVTGKKDIVQYLQAQSGELKSLVTHCVFRDQAPAWWLFTQRDSQKIDSFEIAKLSEREAEKYKNFVSHCDFKMLIGIPSHQQQLKMLTLSYLGHKLNTSMNDTQCSLEQLIQCLTSVQREYEHDHALSAEGILNIEVAIRVLTNPASKNLQHELEQALIAWIYHNKIDLEEKKLHFSLDPHKQRYRLQLPFFIYHSLIKAWATANILTIGNKKMGSFKGKNYCSLEILNINVVTLRTYIASIKKPALISSLKDTEKASTVSTLMFKLPMQAKALIDSKVKPAAPALPPLDPLRSEAKVQAVDLREVLLVRRKIIAPHSENNQRDLAIKSSSVPMKKEDSWSDNDAVVFQLPIKR